MQADTTVRVSVDIGGTFTDIHLYDHTTDRTLAFKTPSTPSDPSVGLINGLRGITELAGLKLSDLGLILHGSTIATNAVLERKLPRGALVTTQGFRDVLEIGRHIRRDVYTLRAEERALLIPRQWRYGVRERVKADGTVLQPLDEAALHAVIDELIENRIETVAIVFLHGYRNPLHEQRAEEIVRQRAPSMSVTTSYLSSPEIREFERTSTTVLNALLQPVISGYLERLSARLDSEGIDASLYLVQSNGGLATPEDAARLPAKLLLSGPAGGAMAMAALSEKHSMANLVGFDMGGTSSDISVVRDGQIGETSESSIDGLPVRLPMVEIRTIGAGGGSIARLDSGALRVGPISAGAEPGPVCYQRGGTEPTVTDANAVLGRIDATAFKTGGMELDVQAAALAVNKRIATLLDFSCSAAASGILDVATANMAGAIRLSLFEKGADPEDFGLVPFGGAAGLHACAVAEELGIKRIVFPANASTLSALGILQADLRYDLSESLLMPADEASVPALARAVESLSQQAYSLLSGNGFSAGGAGSQQRIEFSCDMRYRGQAFELTTPWPQLSEVSSADRVVDSAALLQLIANFHNLHEERFAHASPQDATEIVTVRAVAIGELGQSHSAVAGEWQLPAAGADAPVTDKSATDESATGNSGNDNAGKDRSIGDNANRQRTLYLDGDERRVRCISRSELTPGDKPIDGPLIIEESYTVLLLLPGWRVRVIDNADLLCERVPA
jgi:N-methylhydantoinase A